MKKSTAPPPYEDYADYFRPLEVSVHNFESDVRQFKIMVQKDKILSLYKEKQSYEKPSDKKRRKQRESIERVRVTEMRERMVASGEWDRRQKQKDQKKKEKIDRQRKEAAGYLG